MGVEEQGEKERNNSCPQMQIPSFDQRWKFVKVGKAANSGSWGLCAAGSLRMETHGRVKTEFGLIKLHPSICFSLLLDMRLEWDFCRTVARCSPHLRTQRTKNGV